MINILFGGNKAVFNGILLCLMSMVKHTPHPLNVFVLTADVTELNENYTPISKEEVQILNNVVQSKNLNSKVNRVVLGDDFINWIKNSKNKSTLYTPFAFLRLFANKIEDLPDKLIYFDTDIMINGDINTLFSLDISNCELGVVRDRYGHFFIKPNYFNSGMLLMNMKKIKESNLLEKVKLTCSNKKMAFPDQSALNKCCKSKIYLPRKFNEQGKLKKDTIVHHFSKKIKWFPFFHTVNIKPWQIEDVRKVYKCFAYDDIYDEYQKIILRR